MTQEALKLALEALENGDVPTSENAGKNLDAITAIKEALAQTQECFLVATVGNWGRIEWVDGVFPSIGNKMYSAPPQRTWVGLTEAERIEIDHLALSRVQAVQMTEAKLKEKNT
jgi:hypothetical protein